MFLGLVSEGENSKKGVSSFLKNLQGKKNVFLHSKLAYVILFIFNNIHIH